jgi:hypothetical protein
MILIIKPNLSAVKRKRAGGGVRAYNYSGKYIKHILKGTAETETAAYILERGDWPGNNGGGG